MRSLGPQAERREQREIRKEQRRKDRSAVQRTIDEASRSVPISENVEREAEDADDRRDAEHVRGHASQGSVGRTDDNKEEKARGERRRDDRDPFSARKE